MLKRNHLRSLIVIVWLVGVGLVISNRLPQSAAMDQLQTPQADDTFEKVVQPFFASHCITCHSEARHTAGLNLEKFKTADSILSDRAAMQVIHDRLSEGSMPPPKMPRPKPEDVTAVTDWLAKQLAKERPKGASAKADTIPDTSLGHVSMRRLNRTEYNNTVRDLLGVDLQAADEFPQDDSGYGFDNNGDVLSLSPVLMEKYLAAAERIARTAVFGPEQQKPTLERLRAPDRFQMPQMAPLTDYDQTGLSLPNAVHIRYRFPVAAEYVVRANFDGTRPAGSEPMQIAFWIDGVQAQVIDYDPAIHASFADAAERQELGQMNYEFKARISAGEHWLAVSILHLYDGLPVSYNGPNPSKLPVPPLPEFKPRPDRTPEEIARFKENTLKKRAEKIPANSARIRSLELGGPYALAHGPAPESLNKIYACKHLNGKHKPGCARTIVTQLAHRAYRRPVTAAEVKQLTTLMAGVQKDGGSFDEAVAVAIQAVLISPHFLFRSERAPVATTISNHAEKLSQHELASRLSYFLWSSMPDDALLSAADRGRLAQPAELEAQVRRMLLDPKSKALVRNFGGQWLQVRKLESVKPDRKLYPEFDEYLRQSMQSETELFFESIVREDRSLLDLLDANYTFLNERLARFYNIPDVHGTEFRKVQLVSDSHRGGILGHASVLTVSSYANRTSPVLRGKWVLDNLLGTPPPPPPPDVPNLDESKVATAASMRAQLEAHRSNEVCASCHSRMDPLGFGLENFDAIGAWRTQQGQFAIDASGTLPDGRTFAGPRALEAILKAQPDAFAQCVTRKLLTYALGRGLDRSDDPAVKTIVRNLSASNYRFSKLILEIVESTTFQKRGNA